MSYLSGKLNFSDKETTLRGVDYTFKIAPRNLYRLNNETKAVKKVKMSDVIIDTWITCKEQGTSALLESVFTTEFYKQLRYARGRAKVDNVDEYFR